LDEAGDAPAGVDVASSWQPVAATLSQLTPAHAEPQGEAASAVSGEIAKATHGLPNAFGRGRHCASGRREASRTGKRTTARGCAATARPAGAAPPHYARRRNLPARTRAFVNVMLERRIRELVEQSVALA